MDRVKHLEDEIYNNMRMEDIYHYYSEKEYGSSYMELQNVEQLKMWYYYENGRSKISKGSMDDLST